MAVKMFVKEDGVLGTITVERGTDLQTYDTVIDIVDEHGTTVALFPLHAIVGAVVLADEEQVQEGWSNLDEVPDQISVVTSANGCRWRKGEIEEGFWTWSSDHAHRHGYAFDKTPPFTAGWTIPDSTDE